MRSKIRQKPFRVRRHAYGAVRGRRREEAIGIATMTRSRCTRAARRCIQICRDAKGAFNSLRHDAIQSRLEQHFPEAEARFFDAAHRDAHLTLNDTGTWRIGKGILQGHSIGGDIFLETYMDRP